MDWTIPIANKEVADAYSAFIEFLSGVATHFAGSRLLEALDLERLGEDTEIALSNDFPDHYTTIRNVADLTSIVESGYYSQLSLRFATIQLCTAFEVLFDSIARIYEVVVDRDPPVDALNGAATPIRLGNKTIKQIRKLHYVLAVDTVLNDDDVLIKLNAIIESRNCFVHSGGRVPSEGKQSRLGAYGIRSSVGEILYLEPNLFDDFLHYVLSHVRAFMRCIPEAANSRLRTAS
jgi:hypothetical protein